LQTVSVEEEGSVRRRPSSWRGPIAVLLVLTLLLVAVVPPVVAAEPGAAPKPLGRALAAMAGGATAAQPLPTRALAAPATQTPPGTDALQSKGFWKTKPGVIAIMLMTAGTGYMVYSAFKDNDPVKSQFR
jgi:hypothetical protein